VFAKAREKAREASCESNLKQIGVACLGYSQDYDEQMPQSWLGSNGYGSSDPTPATIKYKWMDMVFPYINSTKVFQCPDDMGINGSTGKYIYFKNLTAPSDLNYGSYGMNSSYWNNNTAPYAEGPANSPGFTVSQVPSPATTVWVSDCSGSYQDSWASGNPTPTLIAGGMAVGTTNSVDNGAMFFRHAGPSIANVLWCDGHVSGMTVGQMTKVNTAGNYTFWTMSGP
jgi:prepilin-type processing-associated H-X9-DG protein